MEKNTVLKGFLLFQTLLMLGYTIMAFKNEGVDLFGVFLSNIQSLTWNGQFNLDFSSYLLLSGIWIMWRNKFTTNSIIIAVSAMIIGFMVFAPYLLYLLAETKGDIKEVLIGER